MAAVLRFGFRDRDGTDFAEGFIRLFVVADVSRMAHDVTVIQLRKQGEPRTYLPKICAAPRKQNVEAPNTRSLETSSVDLRIEVQKCDLYVFQNDASGRELHLFAMSARGTPTPEKDVVDLFIMTRITG